MTTPTIDPLRTVLAERESRHRRLPLAAHLDGSILGRLDPRHAALLSGRSDSTVTSEIVEDVLARTWRWIHEHNQYLVIPPAVQQNHRLALTATAARLTHLRATPASDPRRRTALQRCFTGHAQHVSAVLHAVCGTTPVETVTATYTPHLQLDLLGLTTNGPHAIEGPILDLGCGPEALLVQHLCDAGLDATGADRYADHSGILLCDWPTRVPRLGPWRTIISHQAFALHFLHHHLAGSKHATRYATAYMTILRSLPTGGVFAYAPALPFLEELLPGHRYTVEHPSAETIRIGPMTVPRSTRVTIH